jgi:glutamate synthase (NADPH/NADH) large chain
MTKPANDFATPKVKLSVDRTKPGYPDAQGLYNPVNERDACGIGFVANIKGVKTHKIVRQGLEILENLTHRGAVGADPKAGDGSGLLIQMPDAFMQDVARELDIDLPDY